MKTRKIAAEVPGVVYEIQGYKRGWEDGIAEAKKFPDPELMEKEDIVKLRSINWIRNLDEYDNVLDNPHLTLYEYGYLGGWNSVVIRSTIICGDWSAKTGGQTSHPRARKEVQ